MGQIAETIAQSANLTLLYPELLLNGVTQENYAAFARLGGEVLQSNHPAFVLGHLALYPAKALAIAKLEGARLEPPQQYAELFAPGVDCRDDPAGEQHPPLADLRERYFAGYKAVIAALAEVDDAVLLEENPNEGRPRELFPTRGAMLNFYLGGHVMTHMGQWSAWRRAMGLGPAM